MLNGIRQIVGRCSRRIRKSGSVGETWHSHFVSSRARPSRRGFTDGWCQPRRSGAWIAAAGVGLGVSWRELHAGWAAVRTPRSTVELTRVTADRRNEFAPAFSPDGPSAYLRVGGILTELLVRPLGSDAGPADYVEHGAGAPSGRRMATRFAIRMSPGTFCVGAAGGSPRRVLGDVTWPRIAPDAGTVFFIRVFENRPWLFRGSLAGSEPQRVGEAPLPSDVSALSPVSPDGSALIVTGRSGRWLISLPHGARRELRSETGVRTHSVSWLPDSRHIVVAEEATTLIGSRISLQATRRAARHLVLQPPVDRGGDDQPGRNAARLPAGPVERTRRNPRTASSFAQSRPPPAEGNASWVP